MAGTLDTFTITSEEDAYGVLELWNSDSSKLDDIELKFEGWPKIEVRLTGAKYNSTITPLQMTGFIEFQKALFRAYAMTKYGTSNPNKLTAAEKRDLEIMVKVEKGSSIFSVDFQALLEKLVENVGTKMTGKQLTGIVLSIAVLFFGNSAYKNLLENETKRRIEEVNSQEKLKLLETLKFNSEEETKRMELMAEVVKKSADASNIQNYAHTAQIELIKSFKNTDSVDIAGVTIDGEIATELTKNARKKVDEVRLDGVYRIMVVDSRSPDAFKVTVKNTTNGNEFRAVVQDVYFDQKLKNILQAAEWSRGLVKLSINAKDAEGEIRNAVIVGAAEHIVEDAN